MDKLEILFRKINAQYDEEFSAEDKAPSIEEFSDMANRVRSTFKFDVTDAEFENIKERIQETRSVKYKLSVIIDKQSDDHEFWFCDRTKSKENLFNNRFKLYMRDEKHWSVDSIDKLDANTDAIMDRIGDPEKPGSWRRQGLIIGEVQSGKTVNYTSVCNKAIDMGYRVIIVLAGLTNSLRKQTQQRLEKDFVGIQKPLKPNVKGEIQQSRIVGVGLYGATGDTEVEVFTSADRDFSKAVADTTSVSFKPNAQPKLFVLKKNKSVLTNLHNWFNEIAGGSKLAIPMLLIDDESDNASVNTGEDASPSAINSCIRNILKLFDRGTYLGVTATPFANIFINPHSENIEDADLFPRDFISYIPAPNHYWGSDKLFRDEDYQDMVISVKPDEAKNSFKFGHKKNAEIISLPDTLKDAIRYFMLTNCIRDLRGQREHRSMMVNVSRFVDVQNRMKDKIAQFWNTRTLLYAQSYSKIGEESLDYSEIREIKRVWDDNKLDEKTHLTWTQIQPMLYESNKNVCIVAINQKSGDKLDYDDYYKINKDYLRVIAVGGDCLSRGLTLEGLCVSYFYRKSKMYDTLMQMGRWFGYRPGYADIVKIWMAEEAVEWYRHISKASEELIIEIYRMNRNNLTPMQFGLKVQGHPDALIPTAATKMKNASYEDSYIDIDLSGKLIESPRLFNVARKLDQNMSITKQFIADLGEDNLSISKANAEDLLWENIPSEKIADFIRRFQASLWHQYFETSQLAEYIENNPEMWDIYIKNGENRGNGDFVQINLSENTQRVIGSQKRGNTICDNQLIKISGSHVRVGWGGCTSVTLGPKDKKEMDQIFRELPCAKKDDGTFKETPDDFYLYKVPRSILFIHFIKLYESKDKIESPVFNNRVVVALGLGFKSDEDYETAKTAKKPRKRLRYFLNPIAIKLKEEEGDDSIASY